MITKLLGVLLNCVLVLLFGTFTLVKSTFGKWDAALIAFLVCWSVGLYVASGFMAITVSLYFLFAFIQFGVIAAMSGRDQKSAKFFGFSLTTVFAFLFTLVGAAQDIGGLWVHSAADQTIKFAELPINNGNELLVLGSLFMAIILFIKLFLEPAILCRKNLGEFYIFQAAGGAVTGSQPVERALVQQPKPESMPPQPPPGAINFSQTTEESEYGIDAVRRWLGNWGSDERFGDKNTKRVFDNIDNVSSILNISLAEAFEMMKKESKYWNQKLFFGKDSTTGSPIGFSVDMENWVRQLEDQ